MTFLALDVGERRVGIAVGDTQVRIATPVAVVTRATIESDAAKLNEFAREYDVDALVVGVPHELNGSIGLQANAVLTYVEKLKPFVPLPVEYFDERYSTSIALTRRREAGISEKRGRATLDAAAAAIILQDYLDARHASSDAAKD